MSAGNDGSELVRVLIQLRVELQGEDAPAADEPAGARSHFSCAGDEPVVERLRAELARLGEAAHSEPASAVELALDGAELVMRRALDLGGVEAMAAYLPSFVFLVLLPGLGRERAAELAARTGTLLG